MHYFIAAKNGKGLLKRHKKISQLNTNSIHQNFTHDKVLLSLLPELLHYE